MRGLADGVGEFKEKGWQTFEKQFEGRRRGASRKQKGKNAAPSASWDWEVTARVRSVGGKSLVVSW